MSIARPASLFLIILLYLTWIFLDGGALQAAGSGSEFNAAPIPDRLPLNPALQAPNPRSKIQVPEEFMQRLNQVRANSAPISDRALPEHWREIALRRADILDRPQEEVLEELERRYQDKVLSANGSTTAPDGGPTPVITVGDDGACDFTASGVSNGLQGAMDAAAIDANGGDITEIRVANSGDYTGRHYFINDFVGDQSLDIIGGYDLCSSSNPSSVTTLDATGAPTGPVILIDDAAASETIFLYNLVITGGDAGADNGGGLRIRTNNFVVGSSLIITGNTATDGGGVALEDGNTSTVLFMLDGSAITGNDATGNGGGLHCSGGDAVVALDDMVALNSNNATNNGGGFYASQCQVFSFASVGGGIFGNTALNRGGGGYVADGALFSMIGGEGGFGLGDSGVQTTLDNNSANGDGGGLYVIDAGSSVEITDSQLAFNIADADLDGSGSGGGIRLSGGTSLTMDRTLPGRSCAMTDRCSQIVGNQAHSGGGVHATGNGVSVDIRQTYIAENEAEGVGTAVFVNNNGGDLLQPGTLYMESNVIADNPTSTTDLGGNQGVVDLQSNTDSTIANTTFANNLTSSLGRDIIVFDDTNVRLFTSIIWESTGQVFNATWDADTIGRVDCAILHEIGNLPQTTFGILNADPLFQDPGGADYHLTLASPAVDFCDTFAFTPMENDIDGDNRGRDIVEVPDNLGPFDLGADEFTDIFFSGGFEF